MAPQARAAAAAMPADLDQTLEEMIETTWEPQKGKGKKGKGKENGYEGKGWGKAKGNKKAKMEVSAALPAKSWT